MLSNVDEQSPDIAMGVNPGGAGDQGMMFGYACDETPTLMPMPVYLAHRLAERLTEVRKNGTMPLLRPDGKTQVSVRYEGGRPVHVEKVVVSTQHAEEIAHDELRAQIVENVVKPVLEREGVALADDAEIHVNPTGRFVVGGPQGDSGLTGRKIIVDTYGGSAPQAAAPSPARDPHQGGPLRGLCRPLGGKERGVRRSGQALPGPAGLCHRRGQAGLCPGGHLRHRRGGRGRH